MTTTSPPHPSPLQTNIQSSSPPASPSPSNLSKKRSQSPLSLDLSTIPPLSAPTPPSNTLLITRLSNPKIFHPASLATIREHISSIAPLNSFSPLKSMHRIIVSFYTDAAAILVRQHIDGTAILGSSVAKCYFGEPTPVDSSEVKYLNRPDAGRLFFISPPPSPPVGWEMKHEDPPNKEVHADDLASKLQRLTGKMDIADMAMSASSSPETSPVESSDATKINTLYTSEELQKMQKSRNSAMAGLQDQDGGEEKSPKRMRSRSSTLIYDPKAHGDSPGLPAVMLETEDDMDVDDDSEGGMMQMGMGGREKPIMAHTARPPVELMED